MLGARPARRPPGLDAQGDSGIVSGKSAIWIEPFDSACRSQLKQLLQALWPLTLKMRKSQTLIDDPEGGAHGWAPFSVEPWMASPKMVE